MSGSWIVPLAYSFENKVQYYKKLKWLLPAIIFTGAIFIINGILTSLPVVTYNDLHNLGLQIFTIPVEDFGYLFLLLLMNVTIYEYLKRT